MNAVLPMLVSVCLLGGWVSQSRAVELITPREAQLPAAKDLLRIRGVTRGPRIRLLSPDLSNAQTFSSPFALNVAFDERAGVPIDPTSVKMIYLKAIQIDLTPRLKGAISAQGIELAEAQVPPGEHPVRVRVRDVQGRESNAVLMLTVQP